AEGRPRGGIDGAGDVCPDADRLGPGPRADALAGGVAPRVAPAGGVVSIEGARSRLVRGLVRRVLRPVAGRGRQARAALPAGRRMLLLHLDGLGRKQLEFAMEHGYAPN